MDGVVNETFVEVAMDALEPLAVALAWLLTAASRAVVIRSTRSSLTF
jgi:hypothetical protein